MKDNKLKIAFGKCKVITVFVEKTSPISGKYGLHRYKYKDSLSNVHFIYKNDQLEKIIHLIWKLNRTFIQKSWNLLHCTKNEVFQKGFFSMKVTKSAGNLTYGQCKKSFFVQCQD